MVALKEEKGKEISDKGGSQKAGGRNYPVCVWERYWGAKFIWVGSGR